MSPNEETLTAPKSLRKVHRKSRKGCANCKARRVKCDELKPQCSNCTRRDLRCSFLPLLSSPDSQHLITAGSPGRPEVPSPRPPHDPAESLCEHPLEGLDIEDFSLLHHYTISTSHTLATVPGLQTFMRVDLPQIAFSDRFLLHGVLAVAALHLSRFKKDASEINYYTTKAMHHYGIALRKTALLMAQGDTRSGPALYLFSMLCFSYTLGSGPRPGDFLLFGEHGISDWLVQLRGMRSLLEVHPEILHGDTLSPLFKVAIRSVAHSSSGTDHLPELRKQILAVDPPDAELTASLAALDQLSERFDAIMTSSSQIFPQQVFVWIYQLEDSFVGLLQEGKPIALVILSHFCILLNRLSSFWWTRGWMEHLLSEIHGSLNQEYRTWMRRPMEETGWIPG